MNQLSILAVASVLPLILGATLPARTAVGQQRDQERSEIERVNAASRVFIGAIAARDIRTMEKVWAHESYTTFMGPLSTAIVVGWDGIKKAWEMRFNQFERVTISLAESHIRTNGNVAWAVGVEKVQLLRKNGDTLAFDAFATNVFEKQDGRWLMVSHQSTPIFRQAQ